MLDERRWARALLLLMPLAACSTPRSAPTCPNTSRPRCVTQVECSYDEARNCEICHCAVPTPPPARGAAEQDGSSPERR
jgi:hypothetical protein